MKRTPQPKNCKGNLSRRAFVKQVGGAAVIAAQSASLPLCLAGSGGSQLIKVGPLSVAAKSGHLLRVNNAATGTEYPLDGWRFEIQLEDVSLKLETAQKVSVGRGANSVRVLYDYPNHEVVHTVESGPIAGFAESRLKVRHKAGKASTCGE